MFIAGIDPGNDGAIAFLSLINENIVVFDLPTTQMKSTGATKTKTYIDAVSLLSIMNDHPIQKAYLEKVASSPQMGAVGAFSFGENYGSLKMAVISSGGTLKLVSPQLWKKSLRVPADKGLAVRRASKLFDARDDVFYGPRGGLKDGRAEACMIALYGALNERISLPHKIKVTHHV